LTLGIKWWFY